MYDCDVNFNMLEQTLKANGCSSTNTRRSIYAGLYGQEPISMHELVLRCRSVDRASVYRTVELFERLGIVQRLQTGWKYKLELSGDYHDHHHHATCLICGKTFVISEERALEDHLQSIANDIGFKIARHQLELQGYCSSCRDMKS